MEVNLEEKQNFLRSEIIDQGYDPEEFSKFITEEKGDIGLDLNNWKFEDLKDFVNKFKSKNNNNNNQMEKNVNNDTNKIKENNSNENNKDFIDINNFEIVPHMKEVNEYIKCFKQEKNEFTEMKNFRIIISK